ncbi:unnamed protein product [Effrenium voratum]|uniref:Uncharacterized protein n=1 Tax=Effrenium voratum TaxID=2562239 RepID=A0AA36ISX2_9DINO|nr:unnamed protein product [Effrenium voratum]CAJ1436708.1 unnamed protein product [Effrenium voratum]
MEGWKKALLAATGAAGAGCVLWYLLQEDHEKSRAEGDEKGSELAKVQQILSEIVTSQSKMLAHMKSLTQELRSQKLDFDETYRKLKAVQPDDPVERYGLSFQEFDAMLAKHHDDPKVMEGIHQIMGLQKPHSSEKAESVTPDKIVEVHKYMLEEVQVLVKDFRETKTQAADSQTRTGDGIQLSVHSNKSNYDSKTVTLTAQAMVGAKVEDKYGLSSEDIEHAVVLHHEALANNKDFAHVNMQMQKAMSFLMGGGADGMLR